MALERFSPPGNLADLDHAGAASWSAHLDALLRGLGGFPQFFNPIGSDDDPELTEHAVVWPAFPARLIDPGGSDSQRWAQADGSRDEQDEYCEWSVERSGDEIVRVTFTTETPDYFDHLLRTDPERLLTLYRELLGAAPQSAGELRADGDGLDPQNAFNRPADGRIAHLSQASNTLGAAVRLVAEATQLRERDGARVTDKKALVRCGGLGDDRRSSDPAIAIAVNDLAAAGAEIGVADPPGLYIDGFIATGIRTPDGADASEFWRVTRGDDGHALRASFEVPAERGYSVSELEIDGSPVEFGAQLADRVRVRVVALAQAVGHEPSPQPCVEQDA